jgi:hypothetical protein
MKRRRCEQLDQCDQISRAEWRKEKGWQLLIEGGGERNFVFLDGDYPASYVW